tara:strand:- start:197 stop:889 length:693 start_codon:yes stop_codon:yes gene_type:complete
MINQLEYIVHRLIGTDGNENELLVNVSNKYYYIMSIAKHLDLYLQPKNVVHSILKLMTDSNVSRNAETIFAKGILPSSVSVEVEFNTTQHEAEEVEFTYHNLNESAITGQPLEYDEKDYEIRDAIEDYVRDTDWDISNVDEPEPYTSGYHNNWLSEPEDDPFLNCMNEYIEAGEPEGDYYAPSNLNYDSLESWVSNAIEIADEKSPTWESKLHKMLAELQVAYTEKKDEE